MDTPIDAEDEEDERDYSPPRTRVASGAPATPAQAPATGAAPAMQ